MLNSKFEDRSTSNPLVSIHIVTYNQVHFVHETLQSVLNQEYKNIEIIVADDGSTDGTAEVILEYGSKYPGKVIPLVGGPNLGITKNCNRGLEYCRGNYVAFLGGDDVMAAEKLQIQVAYMEANPDVLVSYHNLEVFDSVSGRTTHLLNRTGSYSGGCSGYIRRGCVNGGSSTMVRTACMPKSGFDLSMPVASDWFFWVQILAETDGNIGYIDQILGRYRRHTQNVTSQSSPFSLQGTRDCITACSRIIFDYPSFAPSATYRLGTLLRSQRTSDNYRLRLISSLRISYQFKTIGLFLVNLLSFGKVRL